MDTSILEYAKPPALIEKSSSAVGFIISLGARFIEQGIVEMDSDLLPELQSLLDGPAISQECFHLMPLCYGPPFRYVTIYFLNHIATYLQFPLEMGAMGPREAL